MIQIIQKSKIWLAISGTLFLISLILFVVWGLKPGIDFTGGSLLEIKFNQQAPTRVELVEKLTELKLEGDLNVQPTGENGFLIRFQSVEEEVHQSMINKLKEAYLLPDGQTSVIEQRYESIGPSIGQELRTKAIYSIIIVLICIILYIAWSFRKVSWPVQSWKYGIVAIMALFHDIMLTIGIFVILGKFFSIEVGLPFIAALLTILGYSINDTIVVFDRIRENLSRVGKADFDTVVNRSVNETFMRSINTALTTMVALVAIYFFGGESIKFFALALIIGIFSGTYSSIFIASPLLVIWEKFSRK
jgi:preprotein translocase subunit SecF